MAILDWIVIGMMVFGIGGSAARMTRHVHTQDLRRGDVLGISESGVATIRYKDGCTRRLDGQ